MAAASQELKIRGEDQEVKMAERELLVRDIDPGLCTLAFPRTPTSAVGDREQKEKRGEEKRRQRRGGREGYL